jgi:radical SAM protein with 4Fe4S-binding SPASM domain
MPFEGFPLIIGWELTLACNIRCRHCGSSAGAPRERELSTGEALAFCDQFPELLVEEVNFTGGEPLLRPDWEPIAARLKELGIRTKILTNGLALGADAVSRMKDVGIAAVGVSLDGLARTHDDIRGRPGLFNAAWEGIGRLRAAGIPPNAVTTVNSRNVSELPGLYEWLRDAGVPRWQLQPVFNFGRLPAASDLSLTEEAYAQFGAFVEEWRPRGAAEGMVIAPADSYGYYTACDTREPEWAGCGAGLFACGITSDGRVKGCLSLPDNLAEGDLRRNDLWDIWFADDAFAYTRDYRADDLGPNCRGCDKAERCRGGCSAMSYGYTGRFHNDPFCFLGIEGRNG